MVGSVGLVRFGWLFELGGCVGWVGLVRFSFGRFGCLGWLLGSPATPHFGEIGRSRTSVPAPPPPPAFSLLLSILFFSAFHPFSAFSLLQQKTVPLDSTEKFYRNLQKKHPRNIS